MDPISDHTVFFCRGPGRGAVKAHRLLEVLIVCTAQGDYVAEAAKAAGELYGYGHTKVLFKPTKAGGNLNMLFFANNALPLERLWKFNESWEIGATSC